MTTHTRRISFPGALDEREAELFRVAVAAALAVRDEQWADLLPGVLADVLAARDEQWGDAVTAAGLAVDHAPPTPATDLAFLADTIRTGIADVVGAMQTPRRIEIERNHAGAITGAVNGATS